MDGKGFLSYRLPCKWGAVLSPLLVITVIIMEMSQQDRMRLLLPAPPSLVSWTLEPGICRRNGNGEGGAPVRRVAKTTCRRGRTVSPATTVSRWPTNFEELTS